MLHAYNNLGIWICFRPNCLIDYSAVSSAVATIKAIVKATDLFINYAKIERMKLIIAEKNEVIAERIDDIIPPLICAVHTGGTRVSDAETALIICSPAPLICIVALPFVSVFTPVVLPSTVISALATGSVTGFQLAS